MARSDLSTTMSWVQLLAYFTGLGIITPHWEAASLVRTVLLTHFLDAIVCRVIATNSGYARNAATLLGLLFGVWAVAVLILLPARRPAADQAARET